MAFFSEYWKGYFLPDSLPPKGGVKIKTLKKDCFWKSNKYCTATGS